MNSAADRSFTANCAPLPSRQLAAGDDLFGSGGIEVTKTTPRPCLPSQTRSPDAFADSGMRLAYRRRVSGIQQTRLDGNAQSQLRREKFDDRAHPSTPLATMPTLGGLVPCSARRRWIPAARVARAPARQTAASSSPAQVAPSTHRVLRPRVARRERGPFPQRKALWRPVGRDREAPRVRTPVALSPALEISGAAASACRRTKAPRQAKGIRSGAAPSPSGPRQRRPRNRGRRSKRLERIGRSRRSWASHLRTSLSMASLMYLRTSSRSSRRSCIN